MKYLLLLTIFSFSAFAQKEGSLEDQIAITSDQVDRFIRNVQKRSGSQNVTSREYQKWSKDFVIKTERHLIKFEADLKHKIFNVLQSKIARHQAIYEDTNIDDRQKKTLLDSSIQDIKTILPMLQNEYGNILKSIVNKYISGLMPIDYSIKPVSIPRPQRDKYGNGTIEISFQYDREIKDYKQLFKTKVLSRYQQRELKDYNELKNFKNLLGYIELPIETYYPFLNKHSISGEYIVISNNDYDYFRDSCPLLIMPNNKKIFWNYNFARYDFSEDFNDRYSQGCELFYQNEKNYLNVLSMNIPADQVLKKYIKGCSVKICIELKKGDVAFILNSIHSDLFRNISFDLPVLDNNYKKTNYKINLSPAPINFKMYQALLQKIDYSQEIQNWPFSDEY